MPREKSQRNLNFKPTVTEYIPASSEINGVCTLLHEEIEAIYLMDVLGLYQEDAAKSMEVSRPTFTRILKSARQKLAIALVSGYKINIEDSNNDEIIAMCSNEKTYSTSLNPRDKYIIFIKKSDNEITIIKTIDNPLFKSEQKTAVILPHILIKNNVNTYIGAKIGEGLKNSLITKGIKPVIKKSIEDIKKI